jgi:tetratricopeptide (TPR) repeat protein
VIAGALRDLTLWLDTPVDERSALFAVDAAGRRSAQIMLSQIEEALWVPIFTLSTIAEDPVNVVPSRLLYACRRVASWAEERGRPATRLAFTQAAALLSTDDAKLALEVAKLARDTGDHARAESWFRHTVRLSRRTDWENYVWGYVGLGVLYISAGNLAAASTVMQRALRTAVRHRLRPLSGVAHHHLFHLAAEAGRARSAAEHVVAALEAYGPDHPRLPYLVSDVAWFWLQVGKPRPALRLFERVLLALANPNERTMVSANSTWAAAVAGERVQYQRMRERTLSLAKEAKGQAYLDHAYTALAYADIHMQEWERAADTANQALTLALATGNAEARYKAGVLRDSALAHALPSPKLSIIESEGFTRHTERLAGELMNALQPVA